LVQAGVTKLTILVFADNERAHRFCRSTFGAIEEGLFVKHTRTRGRVRDVRVLAIFLDP